MRAFAPLFRAELRSRSMLLLVSGAMGLFSVLMPLLSGARGSRLLEVRTATAIVGALLWGLALAVALGFGAVGRDLQERRLGSAFRLPASAVSIVGARLTAGILTLLGSVFLVLAVPLAVGIDLGAAAEGLDLAASQAAAATPGPLRFEGLLLLAPLALVLLLLLAHGAAVALAGNRALLALDLVLVVCTKGAVWIAWRQLDRYFLHEAQFLLLAGTLLLAVAGLFAAALWQGARGRSEPDRAHATYTKALAVGATLVAAASLGYSYWYLHPGIGSLDHHSVSSSIGSHWTLHEGSAVHRGPIEFAILRDTETGTLHHLGPDAFRGPLLRPRVELSADGSTFAWPAFAGPNGGLEIWTLDARDPRAEPRRAPLNFSRHDLRWALSPDGQRIASIAWIGGADRLIYDEIETTRRIATVPLPYPEPRQLGFIGVDQIRVVYRTWMEISYRKGHDHRLDLVRTLEVDLSTSTVGPLSQPMDFQSWRK